MRHFATATHSLRHSAQATLLLLLLQAVAGCGSSDDGQGPPTNSSPNHYGDVHDGQYHLGPVDFAETQWHNACAPGDGYRAALRDDTGTLRYEFQTEANVWWTSFWVRNPRVPVVQVEVQSVNHATFFELRRELDGTLNDDGGFGEGPFTLRLTAMDGQTLEDTFPGFSPGELIVSTQQFD
jgi:expansin (peptidoglycan-binding protein)